MTVVERTPDVGLIPPAKPGADIELLYVGDPMCSWCWGFAPVLERLEDRLDIPLSVIVGGLRTGTKATVMGPAERAGMARYWRRVAEATGQRFTTAALARSGWSYDTEPACRAVVAMRQVAPQHTLGWMRRLHRAFYVDGIDVTDLSAFPGLLDGFGVDVERFRSVLQDPATLTATRADFAQARRWGVAAFPTLLLRERADVRVVTRGFVPWQQLERPLVGWLVERYGQAGPGPACGGEQGNC